jgi:hypothetical protein
MQGKESLLRSPGKRERVISHRAAHCWTAREAEFICELPRETLDDIAGNALASLE